MLAIFALTLFLSSCLLFVVEPMFAKMVLPLLGGTPAVWNTCMAFFQAALLAGYAYAHLAATRLRLGAQLPVHLLLLAVPMALLPVAVPEGWTPPREGNPVGWLLLLLTVGLGLPFLAVSTSAPLLQRWFSQTRHAAARDPYFLYAASNLGSLTGLLGYLVVLEPNLTLREQSRLWSWGYGLLALLTAWCAAAVWWAHRRAREEEPPDATPESEWAAAPDAPSLARRLRWVALAFVPSSLLLGVTTFITTDVASAPFLWVVPLALYLITFMVAFARRQVLRLNWLVRLLPMLVLIDAVYLTRLSLPNPWLGAAAHLGVFVLAALVCHGVLAKDRPDPAHLTGYYLMLSLGGVLGGLFNALLAPVLFRSVAEYPIALVLACALCPRRAPPTALPPRQPAAGLWHGVRRWAPPLLPAAAAAGVLLLTNARAASGVDPKLTLALLGLPVLLCFTLVDRPLRFSTALGLLLAVVALNPGARSRTLHQERSFFGVLRVVHDPAHRRHDLRHGTTLHGSQSLDAALRHEPLTYFSRKGPIGDVMAQVARRGPAKRVGIIGLGAGTLAAYARRGDAYTFYEIDPGVIRLAWDARYFSYLRDARARGASVGVVLGDARLRLAEAPDATYDLLILDAFSSDSIPTHLLTREALALYTSKLAPDGLMALHVSNRYLDLKPVVAALAEEAGQDSIGRFERRLSGRDAQQGRSPSSWTVVAPRGHPIAAELRRRGWSALRSPGSEWVWTDDYSNILRTLTTRVR